MEIATRTLQGKLIWIATPSDPNNWVTIFDEENGDWKRYSGAKKLMGLATVMQNVHEITDAEHEANLQRYIKAWEEYAKTLPIEEE